MSKIIAIFFLALILSRLILTDNLRYAFILSLLPVLLFIVQKKLTQNNIIKILIIGAFFPIPLNVSTTNLGPTSQYFIITVFFITLTSYIIKKKGFAYNKNLLKIICFLLICAIISTITTIGQFAIFRTSFWAFIMLTACCLFLLLIDSLKFPDYDETKKFFIEVMDLIVFLTCIQIIIGIVVYYIPDTERFLKIFYSVNITDFQFYGRSVDINDKRLHTIVLPVESLGEYIAILFPYVMYRLSDKVNISFMAYLVILCMGLMLCGTRSGLLLSGFAIAAYLFIIETSLKKRFLTLVIFLSIISLVLYFGIGVHLVVGRFSEAYGAYVSGNDLLAVTNRSFFKTNVEYFINKLSFFGNGLVSPLIYGFLHIDFHNLYQTIIFQYGMIGSVFYFALPASLIRLALIKRKKFPQEKLYTVILLSVSIFLINECKYEFTRKINGILIIWITFSMYYLFSKNIQCKKHTID